MFSRADLISLYQRASAQYTTLRDRLDEVLSPFALQRGYLYERRVKTMDSYLEKLETGRSDTTLVDDFLACTIVVMNRRDIATCAASLPSRISVLDRKGPETQRKDPDVFRFDDVRLTCRLEAPAGVDANGTVFERLFEVQIKTVTQFAWGMATHKLAYKPSTVDWRRSRLAAQLKAAAEQMDLVLGEFAELADEIEPSKCPRMDDEVTIALRIAAWLSAGLVPAEATPASVARIAQSIRDLCGATRTDIDQLLRDAEKWLGERGFPAGFTVFQFVAGILLSKRWGQIRWKQMGFKILVTSDMSAMFLKDRAVPLSSRVLFESCD
jgi:ppGpp synthetase/RelA/SpoT-type nucleotidyltranferase